MRLNVIGKVITFIIVYIIVFPLLANISVYVAFAVAVKATIWVVKHC